jgi:hypothetical protein
MNIPTVIAQFSTDCQVTPAQAEILDHFCRSIRAFCQTQAGLTAEQIRPGLSALGDIAQSSGKVAASLSWKAMRIKATPRAGSTIVASNPSGDALSLQLDYAGQAHIGSCLFHNNEQGAQDTVIFDLMPSGMGYVFRLLYEGNKVEIAMGTTTPGDLVWTRQPQYPKDVASDDMAETNEFPDVVNPTPHVLQALGFVIDVDVRPSSSESPTSGTPATSEPEETAKSESPTVITGPIWRLECIAGPHVSKSFPLLEKLSIGRSNQADLCLDNERVSRRHAELYFASGHWWLRDLGSSNGTFVNNTFIHEPTRLRDGDEIRIGDSLFRVRGLGER